MRNRSIFIIGIFFIFLLAGRIYGFLFYVPNLHDGQTLSISTTLLSDVTRNGSSSSVSVLYSNAWGSVPMLITLRSSDPVGYGNVVVITGKIRIKKMKVVELFEV